MSVIHNKPFSVIMGTAAVAGMMTVGIMMQRSQEQKSDALTAAPTTGLCTVSYMVDGPFPGTNPEAILETNGTTFAYRIPPADIKKSVIKAVWLKVPCGFDQKTAKVGRRGTYSLDWVVQPRSKKPK